MEKINFKKVIVIPKLSKYELDLRTFKLTHEELIEKYKREGVNADKVLSTYRVQKINREKLASIIPEAKFMQRDDLTKETIKNFDILISLGGDNHFMYVSNFADNKLLIGINSDPKSSEGALTSFNIETFEAFIPNLISGNYKIEEWTRLKVELNGKTLWPLITCDLFLGEQERWNMSRHIIKFKGKEEEQKGSGLLVTTGAGSTGWYDSAVRYIKEKGEKISHLDKKGVFLLTEPYKGKLSGCELIHEPFEEGDKVEVDSLNDSKGVISIDSLWVFNFNRGDKVVFSVSDKPLKVITNSL